MPARDRDGALRNASADDDAAALLANPLRRPAVHHGVRVRGRRREQVAIARASGAGAHRRRGGRGGAAAGDAAGARRGGASGSARGGGVGGIAAPRGACVAAKGSGSSPRRTSCIEGVMSSRWSSARRGSCVRETGVSDAFSRFRVFAFLVFAKKSFSRRNRRRFHSSQESAFLAPRRVFRANERRVRASRTRTRRGSRAGFRRGSSPRSVSTHLFLPARERVVHSRRGALEPRPRGGVERVGAHFRGVVARRSTRLEAHAGAGVVRSDARRGTPSGFAVSAARVDWTRGRKRRRAEESAARRARARSAFIRRWTNSREKTCACRRAGGLPTLRESLAI